jgi:hypothetical protein
MSRMASYQTSPRRSRSRRRPWRPSPWVRRGLSGCFLAGAALLIVLGLAQAQVGITKQPPAWVGLEARTNRVVHWEEPSTRRGQRGYRYYVDLTFAGDATPLRYGGPRHEGLLAALRSGVPLTVRVGPPSEATGFTTDIWEVAQGERVVVSYPEIVEHQLRRAQDIGFTLLFLALGGLSGWIGYSLLRPSRQGRF